MYHQPDFLFEGLAPGNEFIGLTFGDIDVNLFHPGLVRTGEINLSIFCLRPSTLTGTRSFIDIIKYRVSTQTAYKGKANFFESGYKRQI